MTKKWEVELLEYLAQRSGCAYLSDLRFLNWCEKFHLSRKISCIPAESFPLKVWNDALEYLCSRTPEPCAADAKEALIQALSERHPDSHQYQCHG